jgi:phosphate transport system permease protein
MAPSETAETLDDLGVEVPAPLARPLKRIKPREFKPSDVGVLALTALSSFSIIWILFTQLTLLSGPLGFVVLWIPVFLGLYWFVNRQLFNRQVAVDRVIGSVVTMGAILMMTPLVLLTIFVFQRGLPQLTWHALTHTQQGAIYTPGSHNIGGVEHALVGTIEQVLIAAVIGIPAAVLTAIFINEVGGRFTKSVRTIVTAMSGTPAIVAGIFIYSVWVIHFHYSGFAGALALAIILLPTVTRGTEEVLKVVHNDLREASVALAAPEWRTVWSVVLPTARSGLITSILLGIAVSIGETAPLIMTIFGSSVMNANPISQPQSALSLLAYRQIKLPIKSQIELGYTSALVLFIMVFAVFILARLLSSGLGRKSGGRSSSRRSVLSYVRWTPASAIEQADQGPETELELEMDPFGPDSGEREPR